MYRRDQQYGWIFAELLCLAGLVDQAADVLETAVDRGFYNVPMIESLDATLEPIRSHPRFPAILEKARLGAAAVEAVMREPLA